jgi:hypothetical protein
VVFLEDLKMTDSLDNLAHMSDDYFAEVECIPMCPGSASDDTWMEDIDDVDDDFDDDDDDDDYDDWEDDDLDDADEEDEEWDDDDDDDDDDDWDDEFED